MLKKFWKFLSSMQFAVVLLLILVAACAVGSFITQGQSYEWYAAAYSERTAAVIVALYLDDVYHSWWFFILSGFLCCNLLLCNVLRVPQLLRRTKAAVDPAQAASVAATVAKEGVSDPQRFFRVFGMQKQVPFQSEGREALFACKNRAGIWGAWVCHLGILLLILGFGLGQMLHQEDTVYGVPGQSREIGETGSILTIDDFRVDLREDDSVSQYTAAITVHDAASGREESGEISVNHPITLFGRKYYQNSTGWAARVRILKNDAALQDEILCTGEYLRVQDMPDLAIYFNAFYPDYVLVEGYGPTTDSGRLNNPAYLYTVYYQDQVIGMNALMEGETIKIDDYEVLFSEPQNYTVIQVKRDQFTWMALSGGLITLLGLFLAFYLQMRTLWAVRQEDGTWTVSGFCQKGGVLFREQFEEIAAGAENEAQ